MAEKPDADPDDVLREFVALHFPADSREAAFTIYKASFDYVKNLYYVNGRNITDHGRVNRARKIGDRSVPKAWLTQVDGHLDEMLTLIRALPFEGAYRS